MGHDMAMQALKTGRAALVIFAADISPRLIAEFERAKGATPARQIAETMNELHMALGYKAGVLTVDDSNFSDRIQELINQEENVNGN